METSSSRVNAGRSGTVIALAVTLVLLAVTDLGLRQWNAYPDRLPEHFSPTYLRRYVEHARTNQGVVVVLGDSVLWGYGVSSRDTVVAELRRRFPHATFLNLSYEAGGPVNADLLLRYLLANGVKIRGVLLDLNPISFNPLSTAYDTPNVALAHLTTPALLESFDRDKLAAVDASQTMSLSDTIDRFMEDHWFLYGSRVDVHQTLFGDADAATAVWKRTPFANIGSAAAARVAFGDSGSYAEMYDLTPLGPDNVSYAYTQHVFATLAANRIPAVAFLTPTNHDLLHPYIDVAAYTDNLRRLRELGGKYGVDLLNLDRLLRRPDFIDNTHLVPEGNRRLADALAPAMARAFDVF